MLQEETAARKSHWRRVRQKEAELMESERKLANQIFFNFEHLKLNSVKKQLTAMQEVSCLICIFAWSDLDYLPGITRRLIWIPISIFLLDELTFQSLGVFNHKF